MTAVVGNAVPFSLELEEVGAFPSLNWPQVIWVGLSGDLAPFQHLQQRLESALTELGFPAEKRQFKPHLTLARTGDKITAEERRRLGQLVAGTGLKATHRFQVDSLNLMRSQLTRSGAIYSRISSVRLGNKGQG
jgi:2'-5' RNA ligase